MRREILVTYWGNDWWQIKPVTNEKMSNIGITMGEMESGMSPKSGKPNYERVFAKYIDMDDASEMQRYFGNYTGSKEIFDEGAEKSV